MPSFLTPDTLHFHTDPVNRLPLLSSGILLSPLALSHGHLEVLLHWLDNKTKKTPKMTRFAPTLLNASWTTSGGCNLDSTDGACRNPLFKVGSSGKDTQSHHILGKACKLLEVVEQMAISDFGRELVTSCAYQGLVIVTLKIKTKAMF